MISDNHSQTCVSSNYHCFFFNVATCFHLVFYRLFRLKCKFSYHFSYVIQIWHFIELLLLSGVIPANLFLEDQILNKEPKYFRDLSTLSSLKKNKVIRKYWFQIQITFFLTSKGVNSEKHQDNQYVQDMTDILHGNEFNFETYGFNIKSLSLKLELTSRQDFRNTVHVLYLTASEYFSLFEPMLIKKGYLYQRLIFSNDCFSWMTKG